MHKPTTTFLYACIRAIVPDPSPEELSLALVVRETAPSGPTALILASNFRRLDRARAIGECMGV